MHRQTLAACAFTVILVLAGCGGIGADDTPTDTDTPSTTVPSPTTGPPSSNGSADYEATVFDTGLIDQPLIEGGISPSLNTSGDISFYATLVTRADETDRFDWTALPDDAATFVNETDFDRDSILVVQAFPKSSVPDYRVESVTRSGDTLDVRINDSSEMGTDDITLETVLIRVAHDGTPPTSATVTTQNGDTFATGDGPVTVDHSVGPGEEGTDVTLPLTSDDESRNVEDPRDLTIENTGSETAGYNVTIVATLPPECQDAEPPCGMPDRPVVIFHETGKLPPGESLTYEDLIARHGEYDVTVETELSAAVDDSSTPTDSFEWRIAEQYFDAFVTISDDSVEITQSAK
ncbi:MAG: hypothetical protein V5A21_01410 [Halapricum sp.]